MVVAGVGLLAAGLLLVARGPDPLGDDAPLVAPASRPPARHEDERTTPSAPHGAIAPPAAHRPAGVARAHPLAGPARRREALYQMVNQGRPLDAAALERLLGVIARTDDEQSRLIAIWALSRVPAEFRSTAVAELIDLLERHPRAAVRREALSSLAQLRGPRAEQAIRHALSTDADAELRGRAAVLLADLFPESAALLDALRAAAESDHDGQVRTRAIEALAGMTSAPAERTLGQVAQHAATAGDRALAEHKLEERRLLRLAQGSGPAAEEARRTLARMLAAAPEEQLPPEKMTSIVERHR